MGEEITLTLPQTLYAPLRRMADATHQPVENLLLQALEASLPSLEGLAPEVVRSLSELESLDDDALWQVMVQNAPATIVQELDDLLFQNQSTTLDSIHRERLLALQNEAELLALRKARAAVLLRFRGRRIPTVPELQQLTLAE